ncbi:radical SAM protein [Candidatus Riflebacteria bacterium]
MAKFICDYPWTHFEVNNPNGDVTMCCDNQTVLGNVNENTLEEIWNAAEYQEIRERMLQKGAEIICPRDCPVVKGFKSYQNLKWYKKLDPETSLFQNAQKNEEEFKAKKLVLQSKPRWMRFAYSWVCNLACYHCYQLDIRKKDVKLPDAFIEKVYELSELYQVLYFYGGEPFMYKPTVSLMQKQTNPFCRYFFVTNATVLTEEHFQLLENLNIGMFAISLDAATEESYELLRKKGLWSRVMQNLQRIAELKKKNEFTLTISMTVNNKNASEIERFVDLGLKYGAEPLFILVCNTKSELKFQKEYLNFSEKTFAEIFKQIENSLAKVDKQGWRDSFLSLKHLQTRLEYHRKSENNLVKFSLKQKLKSIFYLLPRSLQDSIRKIMQ